MNVTIRRVPPNKGHGYQLVAENDEGIRLEGAIQNYSEQVTKIVGLETESDFSILLELCPKLFENRLHFKDCRINADYGLPRHLSRITFDNCIIEELEESIITNCTFKACAIGKIYKCYILYSKFSDCSWRSLDLIGIIQSSLANCTFTTEKEDTILPLIADTTLQYTKFEGIGESSFLIRMGSEKKKVRRVFSLSNAGESTLRSIVIYVAEDGTLFVRAGCFFDSVRKFMETARLKAPAYIPYFSMLNNVSGYYAKLYSKKGGKCLVKQ